jgi:hypothetical protein
VLLKACGTRRESRCPSCAATYRADAYQLLAAGLKGGKGVPEFGGWASAVVCDLHRPQLRPRPPPQGTGTAGPAVSPLPPRRPLSPWPPGWLLAPPRSGRSPAGRAAVPRLLRQPGPGAVERPRSRALAADHHRPPADLGPPGRPQGGGAATAGPGQLCQGGRVPTPGSDPLPRRHPPGRGHRVPLPGVFGATTGQLHRCPPRGRPTRSGSAGPGAVPAFAGWWAGSVCPLGRAIGRPQHHPGRRRGGGAVG